MKRMNEVADEAYAKLDECVEVFATFVEDNNATFRSGPNGAALDLHKAAKAFALANPERAAELCCAALVFVAGMDGYKLPEVDGDGRPKL